MPKHKHSSSSSSSSHKHHHHHHHGKSGTSSSRNEDRGRKRDNDGRDRDRDRERDRSYGDRNNSNNSSSSGNNRGGRDRNNSDNRNSGNSSSSYREDYNFPRGGNNQMMNSSSGPPPRWNHPGQSNRNPWEQQQQQQPQQWGNNFNNNNQHRRFDDGPYQQQQQQHMIPRRPPGGYHNNNSGSSNNNRGGDGHRNQSRDRQGDDRDNTSRWGGNSNSRGDNYSRDWEQSKRRKCDDSHMQEEQRLAVSKNEPHKIFVEDVNLAPEFAFRIDARPNERQLKYYTLNLTNTSRFQPSYRRDDVFGASEEEWMSLPFRSVFSRCVQPIGMDEDGNLVNPEGVIVDEEGNPMDPPSTNNSDDCENSEGIKTPTSGSKSTNDSSTGSNNNSSSKKKENPKSTLNVAPFIGFDSPKSQSSDKSIVIMGGRDGRDVSAGRINTHNNKNDTGGSSGGVKIHKTGATFRDRVETYNVELRKDAKNIEMWRKFVKFQDQVFEHEVEEAFTGSSSVSTDASGKKTKNKKNRKALAEKKIAILDKAIESNPKCLELHLDRLDIVYEIFKPRYVLGEWKKLVTMYSPIGAFWMEYLRFASTDLQLYTTQSVIGIFEKSFQKFHLMLNPNYPNFQRPEKFLLLMADLMFSLSLILRNAGWVEKALGLHQAQLEIDFHFPTIDSSTTTTTTTKCPTTKSNMEWTEIAPCFELFWDAGTRRFGEPGATGWNQFYQNKKDETPKEAIGLTEAEASEWEDTFFETLTGETEGEHDQNEDKHEENDLEQQPSLSPPSAKDLSIAHHWVTVESFRSTIQYLSWRPNCSDADECDSNERIVLATDLIPFLTPLLPNATHITNFDRGSVQFRHVVNFLLTLREDFLPRTHTLDSILSPFLSTSLTSASTFFSEIYYWKTTHDLYLLKGADEKIVIPEAFELYDFLIPNPFENVQYSYDMKNKKIGRPDEDIMVGYSEPIENLKKEKLKKNLDNYLGMIRNIVESSVESLQPRFASLLAQMYLRFLQRLTYFQGIESHKARMKSAKSLLERNEKLRTSTALYGEIAMLEFYGSRTSTSKAKASDILVKTINSTSLILQRDEKETSGIKELRSGENWETVAEITRFYRLLAELHLREDEKLSLKILTALGNRFEQVQLSGNSSAEEVSGDFKKSNEVLIARRQFERVLSILIPDDDEEDVSILSKWDGDKSVEYLLQNTHFLIEWTLSFALFLYLSLDFGAASDLFTKVLKRFSSTSPLSRSTTYQSHIVNASNVREQLYIGWCKIGIMEVCKDPMQNAKFRQVLSDALTEFPSSPPLLLIFTDVEKQSSVAGKIWRIMMSAVKNESSSSSLHWAPLFMSLGLARKVEQLRIDEEVGLPEFGLGGPAVPFDTLYYKLDAVLSTAEKNSASRNCPLIWRVHLKSSALRGRKPNGEKDNRAGRGIFYEAIRHCPSVKTLYMDALSYFPDMYKEIHDLMQEKQLLIRLPQEECSILLEYENEENDEKDKSQKVSNIDSDENDEEDDDENGDEQTENNESKETIDISSADDGIEEENQNKIDKDDVSEGEITDDG